jgi:Tol biopolymer transport system component
MNRRFRFRARAMAGLFLILSLALTAVPAPAAQEPSQATQASFRHVPTVEDLLGLRTAGSPEISSDGTRVAYAVTETDYDQDAFATQIWLADVATGRTTQLTRGKKSCSGPGWSPDGRWLAFTSSRAGDKSQIFVISPDGGEAIQLTKTETGVSGFEWSPDGKTIAFTASDPESQAAKDRKDYYGDYDVVREEYSFTHLWTVDVADALKEPQAGRRRTSGGNFSVRGFSWSPDGTRIAFSATINSDLINGGTADIYLLDLAAGDTVKKIVGQPGPDNGPQWSPDGASIVFSSAMGRTDYFARNSRLAVVPAGGGDVRSLTDAFDEDPYLIAWNPAGIYFFSLQKTASHVFRLDTVSLSIARVTEPDNALIGGVSISRDGKHMAVTAASAITLG